MDKEQYKKDIEFLAKDEEEAIEGYDKVIEELDEEENKDLIVQLKKIRDEEQAHLDFLNKAKEDEDAKYEDPSDSEPEPDDDEKAEREAASVVFKIDLTKGE